MIILLQLYGCSLVSIVFPNVTSLHPPSFHEMQTGRSRFILSILNMYLARLCPVKHNELLEKAYSPVVCAFGSL